MKMSVSSARFSRKALKAGLSFSWGIRCFSSIVLKFMHCCWFIYCLERCANDQYRIRSWHSTDSRNKCKLITYPIAIFYSPYLKFLCPIVSFSFHKLRQFFLLVRLASLHTNCQQASTNCLCTDSASEMTCIESGGVLNSTHSTPCTDTDTTLRQHCPKLLTRLLPVSVALHRQNRVSLLVRPHLHLISAGNYLPPEIFLQVLLTGEAHTLIFSTMSLQEEPSLHSEICTMTHFMGV